MNSIITNTTVAGCAISALIMGFGILRVIASHVKDEKTVKRYLAENKEDTYEQNT